MRVLLDTSAVLRMALDKIGLSKTLERSVLAASEILVSPIARSEIGIKVSLGKLRLPVTEEELWNQMVRRLQASELTYTARHASRLAKLPLHHRDPFDRMIVCQCLTEDIHLATTDAMFEKYGVKVVM